MWPFSRRRKEQEALVRAAFRRYLSPGLAQRLSASSTEWDLEPKLACIHFLLAQVRDDRVEDVSGYLARAFEIIMESKGVMDSSSGSLVVGWFGVPIWPEERQTSLDNRAAAVARLQAELGPNVKIVTGDRNGLYGNIGSQRRFNFSFVVPEFGRCLETLVRLDYGEVAEAGAVAGGGSGDGG